MACPVHGMLPCFSCPITGLLSGPAITRSIDSSSSSMVMAVLPGGPSTELLVDQIGQIGPGESRGSLGEHLRLTSSARAFSNMHPQNSFLPRTSGRSMRIWRSAPGRNRPAHIRPAGACHYDAFIGVKAVHLHQQLIEGCSSHHARLPGLLRAAGLQHRFHHEHYAGAFSGLLEQALTRQPHLDKHLHEVGAADGKRHSGPPATALAIRVLPVPGAPYNNTFRILAPNSTNFADSEEFHYLLHLFLGLSPGDILKSHLDIILRHEALCCGKQNT